MLIAGVVEGALGEALRGDIQRPVDDLFIRCISRVFIGHNCPVGK